jgi:hypothetical protein
MMWKYIRFLIGPGTLPGLVFSWLIWSSAFVTLYGLLSLGCMYGWTVTRIGPFTLLTVVLIAVWLAHVAALAVLGWHAWRADTGKDDADPGNRRLLGFATRAGYLAALVGTVWIGFPILMIHPCA